MIKYVLIDKYNATYEEYDHKPTSDDLKLYEENYTDIDLDSLVVYEVSNSFNVKKTFTLSAEKIVKS